jgi:hypothetical protein
MRGGIGFISDDKVRERHLGELSIQVRRRR